MELLLFLAAPPHISASASISALKRGGRVHHTHQNGDCTLHKINPLYLSPNREGNPETSMYPLRLSFSDLYSECPELIGVCISSIYVTSRWLLMPGQHINIFIGSYSHMSNPPTPIHMLCQPKIAVQTSKKSKRNRKKECVILSGTAHDLVPGLATIAHVGGRCCSKIHCNATSCKAHANERSNGGQC